MALTTTAAVVPFPAGVVALSAPATAVVGVILATPNLPRAVVSFFIGSDPTAASDYRPVCDQFGNPLQYPVGLGGYFPIPANAIPAGAKIEVALTNAGSAAATVNLIST